MWDLFEEIIRVPLLFVGYGIPSAKTITQQVRHIDIFPTAMEIIGLKQTYYVEGQSLVPLFHNKKVEEMSALIQNMTTNPKKPHNVIGIRTSDYKYYRSVENSKKSVTLFDLKNDPSENNNIAEQQKSIVKNMEKLLSDFLSKSTVDDIKQLDDEKLDIVADELKKLGYV
jgi:arylsulfatase A-like enzyme